CIFVCVFFSLGSRGQQNSGEPLGVNTTLTRVNGWRCSIALHITCNPYGEFEASEWIREWELPSEDECRTAIIHHTYKEKDIIRTNNLNLFQNEEFVDLTPWGPDCVTGRIFSLESGDFVPDNDYHSIIENETQLLMWGQDLVNVKEWVEATTTLSPSVGTLINQTISRAGDFIKEEGESFTSKINKIPSIGESVVNQTKEVMEKAIDSVVDKLIEELLPIAKWICIIVLIIIAAEYSNTMGNCTGKRNDSAAAVTVENDRQATDRVLLGAKISAIEKYNPEAESPFMFCRRIQDDLNVCCPDVNRAKGIIATKLEPIHRDRLSQMHIATRFGSNVPLETFFDELCEVLVTKRERELAYQRMYALVKADFETVDEYAYAIKFEGDFAFPSMSFKGKDAAIMAAFIEGLDGKTKFHMSVVSPTSLDKAVEIARIVENLLRANNKFEEDEHPTNAIDFHGMLKTGVHAANGFARVAFPLQYQAVKTGVKAVGSLARAAEKATFIFSLNPQALPKIPLSISNHVLPTLWDSGAGCSYISRSTSKLLSQRPIKKTGSRGIAANGESFKFIGELDCFVEIGSLKITHTFLISNDRHCPASALFGLDFMDSLESVGAQYYLSTKKKTLTVGKDVIFFPSESHYSQYMQYFYEEY
ncbi:hypothetical protein PFISCL1PPCAC_26010, partial [Pristionchus fissidentatus]